MIRWDEEKNKQLKRHRQMSFERIAEVISNGKHLDVVKHPTRVNQRMFVVRIEGYVWVVPFVVDGDGETVFLKTAFPSRKFNRIYGRKKHG